jgi:hypothetical protein
VAVRKVPAALACGAILVGTPAFEIHGVNGSGRDFSLPDRWWARPGQLFVGGDRQRDPRPTVGRHSRPRTGESAKGRGHVAIVFDSPDHVRLHINDDEIVDRCAACQTYSGPIMVMTYDTGLYQRALAARLEVTKLRKPDDSAKEDAT